MPGINITLVLDCVLRKGQKSTGIPFISGTFCFNSNAKHILPFFAQKVILFRYIRSYQIGFWNVILFQQKLVKRKQFTKSGSRMKL